MMRFLPIVYVDPLIRRTYKMVERKGHIHRAAKKRFLKAWNSVRTAREAEGNMPLEGVGGA